MREHLLGALEAAMDEAAKYAAEQRKIAIGAEGQLRTATIQKIVLADLVVDSARRLHGAI